MSQSGLSPSPSAAEPHHAPPPPTSVTAPYRPTCDIIIYIYIIKRSPPCDNI